MADVYSAIILDSDYWDGTESWAGETSEANRDTKYSTRVFTSPSNWESGRDDLSSDGDDEYGVIIGPWASVDANYFDIGGWSTGATGSINLICPLTLPDGVNLARHLGQFGASNAYLLEASYAQGLITINTADNVTIDGIQIHNTVASDSYNHCILAYNAVGNLTIVNCIFSCADTGGNGFVSEDTGTVLLMHNCIIFCPHTQGGQSEGIFLDFCTSALIYNVIVENMNDGIERDTGTVAVRNCAVFNNNDDFDNGAQITIEYCANDDGESGTGNIDWDNEATDWDANFTDRSVFDYIPLDVDLPDAGIGPSSDANVLTTDIIGNTRSGTTCTIGAFEYLLAGVTHNLKGVAGGLTDADGIMVASRAMLGGVAGLGGADASLIASRLLLGSAAGLAGVDGILTKGFVLKGTTGGLSTVDGLLNRVRGVKGGAAGLSGADGSLVRSASMRGGVGSAGDAVGNLITLRSLLGTAGGTSAIDGVLVCGRSLLGLSEALSAATGKLSLVVGQEQILKGTVAAISGLAGILNLSLTLSGGVAGLSGADASLITSLVLSGDAAGLSQAIASLTISGQIALVGTIAALSGADGSLIREALLSGGSAVISSAGGILVVERSLLGAIGAVGDATGALTIGVVDLLLKGAISAISGVDGILVAERPLIGSVAAISGVAGNAVLIKTIRGVVQALASVDANIKLLIELTGSVDAAATLLASLTVTTIGIGVIIDPSIESLTILRDIDSTSVDRVLESLTSTRTIESK